MADNAKQPLVDNWTMSRMVTVNEARKDRGLPALPGPDGDLTVDQYDAKLRAERDKAAGYGPGSAAPQPGPRAPFKNMR